MFSVIFYEIEKRNNSTKRPNQDGSSFECSIKNISNILNPSIELKHQNPTGFNYCFIEEFERYYFISNWTWNSGLWIASCTIDVLATYKPQIANSTLYVLRSASNSDGNLIDNMSPLLATSNAIVTEIYPYENQGGGVPSIDKGVFVIGVVGNNLNGQIIYEVLPEQFRILLSTLLTTADGYDWGDLTQGVINSLMNPTQYISSCRWYPKEFIISGSVLNMKFGNWNSGVTAYNIAQNGTRYELFRFPIEKHPQTNTKGNYMNLSPFTTCTLDLGVFGIINLDTTMLIDQNYIAVEFYVDAYSGLGTAKGYAETGDLIVSNRRLLFKKDVMFGVNIPLSANDSNAVPDILGTASAIGIGAMTGDVGAIISGASNIGNCAKAIQGTIETTSTSGSIVQHLRPFRLHQTFRNQADIDYTNNGHPLMKNVQIGSLNGFVLCKDGNIELNSTDAEKEKIRQYLTTGFYYE